MEFFNISITEWVGYIASFFLLISFTMKDVAKLRIINSVGCALFVTYGFMLQTSWPVVITNGSIMLINFYYLFLKKK
ncbi:uroporphyrinogen decarboxylase [Formosa algae]|nr:uroporphyrinogen decarboxylase [Formosa algae]